MSEINKFISLYQKNAAAQVSIILSIDVLKSFLYDKTIPILNNRNTKDVFISYFLNISYNFSESIFYGSKEKALLKEKYLNKYFDYQEGNFFELLEKDIFSSTPINNYCYLKNS